MQLGPGALISPRMVPLLPDPRGERHKGQGWYSDSRLSLLIAPSRLKNQWLKRFSSPVTAAGPFRIYTGFPLDVVSTP